MRWSDLLRMSVSSLRRRKLRTFLTVLGVVIGTASIVVMISLGLGLQESMYKEDKYYRDGKRFGRNDVRLFGNVFGRRRIAEIHHR